MRVEYDKVSNKCVPKVKVDGPEEEMRTLISIDGVSTQCILEYAAGIYQKVRNCGSTTSNNSHLTHTLTTLAADGQ